MSSNNKPKVQAQVVITGHRNADFDCFASIVAASKLYPGAALAFPGSQEKSLRDFYINSAAAMFNFVAPKDIDPESVETLVVVDTRQRSRVAHVDHILAKPGLVIHTYDHHPDSDDDLPADKSVWKAWGSCAAIIAAEIREQGQNLTPEEATAIGLGVYEDTGSFTFSSTTPDDMAAGAWLLSQGLDLKVISEVITRELDAQQVAILGEMLESAQSFDVGGVQVVITEATMEHYTGDFALLAHKLMDMEHPQVLFAIGRMGDRITLVARSKHPAVDVAAICERFGGGGHSYAASASVKDALPAQVKDSILAGLYGQLKQELTVDKLMSRPAVSVHKLQTVAQAVEIMTRYGLKALPVLEPDENGTLVGLLEHDIADKAMAHGLAGVEVREYMGRNVATLRTDDTLRKAMDVVLGGWGGQGSGTRQRLAPVVDKGKVVGVVTRTDLINALVHEPARMPRDLYENGQGKSRNIGSIVKDQLPRDIQTLLKTAGSLGDKLSMEVYAVGGFVRDLLLRRPNLDIDPVVEGDGVEFARALAGELGGRVKPHHKFKTAVVILEQEPYAGLRVDVATARLEYYEQPAALPVVELSSIKMDLYRRDFTINALAVHLNPGRFGQLEDFFGGRQDLKNKAVRVLHSLSFVEDPTRILRAIRFEQRFGFTIGGQTERLIKGALKMDFFERLSGARIFHELELIFEEAEALKCLERMAEFTILRRIHPQLQLDPKRFKLLSEIEAVRNWHHLLYEEEHPQSWKLFLLGMCDGASDSDAAGVCHALGFTDRRQSRFMDLRIEIGRSMKALNQWNGQWKDAKADQPGRLSSLAANLRHLPLEGLLFLMARAGREEVRKAVSTYVTRLRHLKADVSGQDLKDIGLKPGPDFARILDALLAAKIDGVAECREEQLDLARQLASGEVLGAFKPS